MPHVFLETERLLLRRVTVDDEDALVELDGDPAVTRYTGAGLPTPREVIRDEIIPAWLRYYDRFEAFGFWVAVEKTSGAFLGWFHFRPHPDGTGDGVELGYRLRRSAWGKGYATEGSAALVSNGFTRPEVLRVYAEASQENTASWRVMEKVGLRFVRSFSDDDGTDDDGAVVEYAVTRDEWDRRSR